MSFSWLSWYTLTDEEFEAEVADRQTSTNNEQ